MTTHDVIQGDALATLKELPDGFVQTCITSPPYWGLRDYGVEGQTGLEETPQEYIAKLVRLFQEVRRVMKDNGTLWLNLGDSYVGNCSRASNNGRAGFGNPREGVFDKGGFGLVNKNLMGMPWRVAFALQDDGWILRSDIIWAKPNPMPESVKDRLTRAHEYVFLFSKSERYYYDHMAVREPFSPATFDRLKQKNQDLQNGGAKDDGTGNRSASRSRKNLAKRLNLGQADKPRTHRGPDPSAEVWDDRHEGFDMTEAEAGRNKRDVWTVAAEPFAGAHFAVMPTALVKPCVMAGSKPGDVVMDPFTGSGTVGAVSVALNRDFTGIELNPEYADMARARIKEAASQGILL